MRLRGIEQQGNKRPALEAFGHIVQGLSRVAEACQLSASLKIRMD
jgi:hypothetical protein